MHNDRRRMKKLQREEQSRRIYELRSQGFSPSVVAERLGLSRWQVNTAYCRYRRKLKEAKEQIRVKDWSLRLRLEQKINLLVGTKVSFHVLGMELEGIIDQVNIEKKGKTIEIVAHKARKLEGV